jgi:hypothetical protein
VAGAGVAIGGGAGALSADAAYCELDESGAALPSVLASV